MESCSTRHSRQRFAALCVDGAHEKLEGADDGDVARSARGHDEADRMLEDMTRAMDGAANEGMEVDPDSEQSTIGRTRSEQTMPGKKARMEGGVGMSTKVRRDGVKAAL